MENEVVSILRALVGKSMKNWRRMDWSHLQENGKILQGEIQKGIVSGLWIPKMYKEYKAKRLVVFAAK